MAADKERNYLAGWLALLLLAGGAFYLMRDSRAGERRDREAALRERCIETGKAAWRSRDPAAPEMSRAQAADLVGRCFGEARRGAE